MMINAEKLRKEPCRRRPRQDQGAKAMTEREIEAAATSAKRRVLGAQKRAEEGARDIAATLEKLKMLIKEKMPKQDPTFAYLCKMMQAELDVWRERYPHAAVYVSEEAAAKIEGREPRHLPSIPIGSTSADGGETR